MGDKRNDDYCKTGSSSKADRDVWFLFYKKGRKTEESGQEQK